MYLVHNPVLYSRLDLAWLTRVAQHGPLMSISTACSFAKKETRFASLSPFNLPCRAEAQRQTHNQLSCQTTLPGRRLHRRRLLVEVPVIGGHELTHRILLSALSSLLASASLLRTFPCLTIPF